MNKFNIIQFIHTNIVIVYIHTHETIKYTLTDKNYYKHHFAQDVVMSDANVSCKNIPKKTTLSFICTM